MGASVMLCQEDISDINCGLESETGAIPVTHQPSPPSLVPLLDSPPNPVKVCLLRPFPTLQAVETHSRREKNSLAGCIPSQSMAYARFLFEVFVNSEMAANTYIKDLRTLTRVHR